MINQTLHSLIYCQTQKPDEIVIVNGGGENNCKPILDKWKTVFENLKVIETENINLATSRNIGLPYCAGDIILQTDDDARPLPDWIEKIVKYHEKYPDAGVIGGNVIDNSGLSFLSRIADVTTFPHHETPCEVRTVAGVNSSYKSQVIEQVGQYDESLFRGEDVDYNWRAIQKGWKVYFIPKIMVIHIHRASWKGLFNQHYMYGRAHFLVRKKWPLMYSHYPLNIDSLFSFFKWIASWIWTPWIDAVKKSRRMNTQPNGFDVLTIGLVNMANRVGSSLEKNYTINE